VTKKNSYSRIVVHPDMFHFLGRPKAFSFTHELSFFLSFLLYQSTVLSSHAVDSHKMYFGGSS